MADDVTLSAGTADGAVVATDDDGSRHHQYVKVEFGADNTQTKVAAASGQGLPIQGEAAENAAVTGNPVLVGGRYDATPRTLGDGDVGAPALDADGALHVSDGGNALTMEANSVVDANNSTTSTLVGDAVYTGTGTDLLGKSTVCITLYADVDSATDGMSFQFSTDNSNWDDIYLFTMDVSASDTRRFQFPVCARYFRLVYTNGSGAQSAFRVQTILHTANQLSSIHRLVTDMTQDRSAQVVKAVLFGKGSGGSPNFTPIDATNGGNLKVSVEEFGASLPAGTNNIGDVDVLTAPGVDTEGSALASGVLIQGDDGTDRKNINVHATTGDVQVDVTNTVTVDAANDSSLNVVVGDGSNTATIRNLAANDSLNVAVVDGSGNQITSFGGSGGTAETDDAAFTAGSGSGTPMMGFVTSDSVDSGDVGVVGMDATRNLKVSIEADNVGIGGGTQYTDDTSTHAPDSSVGPLLMAAATPTDGSVDANDIGAVAMSTDRRLHVDAQIAGQDAALDVSGATVTVTGDAGGSLTVDNAGLSSLAGTVSGSQIQVDVVDPGTAQYKTVIETPLGDSAMDDTADALKVVLQAADGTDIGDVDVASQPARVRTTDTIAVALQTDAILNDTTALTPKFARINGGTNGDNELVALVGGKKIRVLSITLVAAGNVTVNLQSSTAGTYLAGPFEFDGSTQPKGVSYSFSPVGHFETASGESLNMELDATINVGGSLCYVEV